MIKDEMLKKLATRLCKVEFTKINGETRIMRCTREIERVPMEHRPKGEDIANDTTLRVFDVDANGWRSFRVDNVIDIEVLG